MPPLSLMRTVAGGKTERFPHPDISSDISYTNIHLSNEDEAEGGVNGHEQRNKLVGDGNVKN